ARGAVDEHEAAHLGIAPEAHVAVATDERERPDAAVLAEHDASPAHRREPAEARGGRDLRAPEAEQDLLQEGRGEEDGPEEDVAPGGSHAPSDGLLGLAHLLEPGAELLALRDLYPRRHLVRGEAVPAERPDPTPQLRERLGLP